jgi:hypothetical protein
MLIDLRGTIALPTKFGVPRIRSWGDIRGVTFHQTGCNMGEVESHWHSLDAHIGITRGGQCFVLQPFDRMIWHAEALSLFTIGIEIEGTNPGFHGNCGAVWPAAGTTWFYGGSQAHPNPPTECTDEQAEVADDLFALLQSEFAAHNQAFSGVWTHRQSSSMRTCDCGPSIWQRIAMKWREQLQCDPLQLNQAWPDEYGKHGAPVPKEWDPASSHGFWDA